MRELSMNEIELVGGATMAEAALEGGLGAVGAWAAVEAGAEMGGTFGAFLGGPIGMGLGGALGAAAGYAVYSFF